METQSNKPPSTAMRSYQNDPQGFLSRMLERAEALWLEDYSAEPGEGIGLFIVHTPKGDRYTVNVLEQSCTCAFWQGAEDMRAITGCKHLCGLEMLITEQLAQLKAIIGQHELSGHPERAQPQREEFQRLSDAWQATEDAAIDRQAEEEEDGRLLMAETVAEFAIANSGYRF